MATDVQTVTQTHIELRPNRAGQLRAYIAGTRIRVQDVYVQAELRGKSPDEIVDSFPHLTLAQVHAALAYYYDHRDEILEEMRQDRQFADEMEAAQGPTRLTKLREQLLEDGDGDNSAAEEMHGRIEYV